MTHPEIKGGVRPIADVQYGDFLFCMMDQLANQAAKMRYMSGGTISVPMVMRAPVGATARGSQHAQSLEAFFTHVPGLMVVAPATAYDAKGLLKAAIRNDNPVLVFEHKLLYGSKGNRSEKGAVSPVGEVPDEDYTTPIGEGIIRRPGNDVTIVANLLMLYRSLAAAEAPASFRADAAVWGKTTSRLSCRFRHSPIERKLNEPPPAPVQPCGPGDGRRRSDWAWHLPGTA